MRTKLRVEKRSFCYEAIFDSPTMQKYVNLIAFLKRLFSKDHVVVIMEFSD